MSNKTRKGFDDSLTLISLFGFLVITLNAFTGVDLHPWTNFTIMVLAGGGLLLEGNIMSIRNWAKDGIQRVEVPYLLTILFGVFTIIVGILSIPVISITSVQLQTVTGIVAILAMAFISIQRWIIN